MPSPFFFCSKVETRQYATTSFPASIFTGAEAILAERLLFVEPRPRAFYPASPLQSVKQQAPAFGGLRRCYLADDLLLRGEAVTV